MADIRDIEKETDGLLNEIVRGWKIRIKAEG